MDAEDLQRSVPALAEGYFVSFQTSTQISFQYVVKTQQ